MGSFISPYDIANRALQHMEQPRISSFSDLSMQAVETGFAYDKMRRAELRRSVWTFATRRCVLRQRTGTMSRLTFATFSPTTTYAAGDIVADANGYLWIATAGGTGVYPPSYSAAVFTYNPMWQAYFGPAYVDVWGSTANYINGDVVALSGVYYLCVAANTNQSPPNATYWHPIQGAATAGLLNFSPGGFNQAGTTARTAFYLPNNFMRLAAQDPKQPGTSHLSVSAGLKWSDWELESGVLYSATLSNPYVLRFVADVQDVTSMDDLFCEAVAARMGMALVGRFTSSEGKLDEIKMFYQQVVAEARAMSSIEAGSTEDDFQAPEQQPAARRQQG